MRGYTQPYEVLDGISIYRHWISEEAAGIGGFLREYTSALWGELRMAVRAWRDRPFQIIHLCNPPDLLFLVALPFKILFGTRIVYDVHDLWPEMFEAKFGCRSLLYWGVRLAERCTFAVSNVCIATNESVREVICQRGKRDDVFVVRTSPNAINTEVEADETLRKGRKHLVGYIGVMGDADGVNYLIEAVALLVEKGRSDIQFLIMGSGPEYDRLVKLRNELNVMDFVDMPGRVADDFLSVALRTIDLGVGCDPINPYNDHCTMNKTLEYMAFGKPQVLFGIKEGRVSAGEAAEYIMENSASALAAGIESVLADPEKMRRMGAQGLRRLSGPLSWERSVENLIEAYRAAV
jgi:glycosyltransferase involved in cell wall biosynthesis